MIPETPKTNLLMGKDDKWNMINFTRNGKFINITNYIPEPLFKRWNGRVVGGRPVNVTPVHSFTDDVYPHFVHDVVEELNAWREDEQFSELHKYVQGGFDAANCVGGVVMQPRGFNVQRSQVMRDAYNLPAELNQAQKRLCRILLDILFEKHVLGSLRVRGGTSSGAPYLTSDKNEKLFIAKRTLNNELEVHNLTVKGKYDELRRKYGLVYLSVAGGRLQQERLDKDRATPSISECVTGEKDPNYPEIAKKFLNVNGVAMSAMRGRVVNGTPTALNILIAKYFKPFDDVFVKRFALTFKNRDADSTSRKLDYAERMFKNPSINYMDVVTYDKTFPGALHVEIENYVRENIGQEIGDLLMWARSLPSLVGFTQFDKEYYEANSCLTGDPEDREWCAENITNLPSGIFVTSLYGKLGIYLNHIYMVEQVLGSELRREDILAMLTWSDDRFPIMINGGDDHVVVWEAELMDKYNALAETSNEVLFRLAPEDNSIYLGSIYIKEDKRYKGYPNAVSYVTKTFAPERGYDSRQREKGWVVGLHAKMNHYAANPAFTSLLDVIDRVHARYYGYTWRQYVATLPPVAVTASDEILTDPDTLYYKYDFSDLTPEQYESLFSDITPFDIRYKCALPGEEVEYTDLAEYEREQLTRIGISVDKMAKLFQADNLMELIYDNQS